MNRYFNHPSTAKKCHLYRLLKKTARRKHLSFHTPGHKCPAWDITELSFSDCLAHPTGVLLRARQDVEKIVRSAGSEFLTDGSTSGVYALVYLLKEKGAKRIALSPFSHISVFRAMAMFGLTPVVIEGQTPFSQPTTAQVEKALEGADALFLTSPNYYGERADLSSMRALCDTQNKPLIVDGAHGGHLHYEKDSYAGSYADGWVDGVHKSMPAMTQAALVSVAREDWVDDLRKIVPLFRTTSPSYPVMASIEYAYKYPRNKPLEEKATAFIGEHKDRIRQNQDWTKICAYFGEHSEKANEWLESQGIYPEFCDGGYVVFYLSPATKSCDFKVLTKKLVVAFNRFPATIKRENEKAKTTLLHEKLGEKEWVLLKNATGRVAASSFGIFPPCLPIAVDGQLIDEEIVSRMTAAKHVFGVEEEKILVYKGEEQ